MAAILALFAAMSVAQWITLIKWIPVILQLLELVAQVAGPAVAAAVDDIKAMIDNVHSHFHGQVATGATDAAAAASVQRAMPGILGGKPAPIIVHVKRVQQRLNDLGFGQLLVDGKWGPRTSASLALFQKDRGLAATGRVDADTLLKLAL